MRQGRRDRLRRQDQKRLRSREPPRDRHPSLLLCKHYEERVTQARWPRELRGRRAGCRPSPLCLCRPSPVNSWTKRTPSGPATVPRTHRRVASRIHPLLLTASARLYFKDFFALYFKTCEQAPGASEPCVCIVHLQRATNKYITQNH